MITAVAKAAMQNRTTQPRLPGVMSHPQCFLNDDVPAETLGPGWNVWRRQACASDADGAPLLGRQDHVTVGHGEGLREALRVQYDSIKGYSRTRSRTKSSYHDDTSPFASRRLPRSI